MRENGTDRDVALLIVGKLNTIAAGVAQINDNLYVPHIVTQPTNQTAAVGDNAVFTVVANNVTEYIWKYRAGSTGSWRDITPGGTITGIDTATLTVPATETRYGFYYRCTLTGKDGSTINTELVQIIEPIPEG